jgi:hypothetical protein
MSYQITDILQKATKEDAGNIIKILKSFLSFTDDSGLRDELANWETGIMPVSLARKLEKEIRYLASNNIAYTFRKVFSRSDPPGIGFDEVINDVAKKLKIKLRKLSSIEEMLKHLVISIAIKYDQNLKNVNYDEITKKEKLDKFLKNYDMFKTPRSDTDPTVLLDKFLSATREFYDMYNGGILGLGPSLDKTVPILIYLARICIRGETYKI